MTFQRLRGWIVPVVLSMVAAVPGQVAASGSERDDRRDRTVKAERPVGFAPGALPTAPPIGFSPGALPTAPPVGFSPGALPKAPAAGLARSGRPRNSRPPSASPRHPGRHRRSPEATVVQTVVFVGMPVPHQALVGEQSQAQHLANPEASSITSFSSVGGPDGAIAFKVAPATAEVHVDGRYVGTAETFSALALTLTPGSYYVEIRAQGYRTLTFDAAIEAGKTTPIEASLRPIR